MSDGGASGAADARASIEHHSKSFALAAKLLPPKVNHDAVVLYAYCRRADDMIDLCAPSEQLTRLAQLRAELSSVYARAPQSDPLLAAFAQVIEDCAVPRAYLDELLLGMEMDSLRVRYHTLADVLLYAYRVAGVVGLMMCHVMGVRRSEALRHAAHLGMAMQLSNIARDVGEDWERGRLYLPDEVLPGVADRLGAPLAMLPRGAVAAAVERLLGLADGFYASGDRGIRDLPWRAGFAVRAARAIYARIGREIERRGFDPLAGRAVVPTWRKVWLALGAGGRQLVTWATRPVRAPGRILELRDAL